MIQSITDKLTEQLDYIKYSQQTLNGIFLEKEDVQLIFNTLKKYDLELFPLLETVEKISLKMFDIDHYYMKNIVKELLEYYNIIENPDCMKSRHKLFFTESKNLVKKPYLSENVLKSIKDEFNKRKIFSKVSS